MWVVADIETEKLDTPEKIWCVVCKEVDSGETSIFRNLHNDPSDFLRYASRVTCWIGHNFLGFDVFVLNRITNSGIELSHVIDTLVVSRLLDYSVSGGHSLEAIGERLGYPKNKFDDFSQWSQELEDRCVTDVEITYKQFQQFKPYIFSPQWKDALRLEHDMAVICYDLHVNGFHFDKKSAETLHKQLDTRIVELYSELTEAFPPKTKLIREITPKATKHGTISLQDFRWLPDPKDLSVFKVDCPFSRFEYEPFNPGSTKQIVERLNEAGWRPTDKTKTHIEVERDLRRCRDFKQRKILEERLEYFKIYGWKVSEENLNTLPSDAPPSAKKLKEYLTLSSRKSTLEEWLELVGEDSKIHGTFHNIGAWTQRMSHSKPNMANIPRVEHDEDEKPLLGYEGKFAVEMRSMFQADPGEVLVGVDAEGIQLRILAHYMNDPVFTHALVSGRKEDGSDAHTLNMKALGEHCKSRNVAKTFIYAWLLGAGTAKIAEILECGNNAARDAAENFLNAYPGLRTLKEEIIPRDAERGYFQGLDGRFVLCENEHLMLAGYLQAGEAVIMKWANRHWRRELDKLGIYYKQRNFVHDEWQTGTYEDVAEVVKQTQINSIVQAGLHFNLNCPLSGSGVIGRNWYETH